MATRQMMRAPNAGHRPDFTDQLIEPFSQFRTEVDRLFEGFPFRLPTFKFARFAAAPAIAITETDKFYKITAELPGIEAKDVDVTFEDGIFRIAGDKKEEREENERDYRLSERSYGAFERLVALPSGANPEKIDATFKNGVLTITVAKNGEERPGVRKIKIGCEA